MSILPENRKPIFRILVLALLMLAGVYLLLCRLYKIQIVESRAYANSLRRQSIRRVLMPAPRGRIFDRDGNVLADNRPSYCIAFFIEEMRRPGQWINTIDAVDGKIGLLSERLGIPREISREDVSRHVYRQLPLPLLAWQDIDEKTLARFSELVSSQEEEFAGMDVYVQPERVYPNGRVAAHILGYVGRDKPQAATNEVAHYNIMGMKGRSGVELYRNGSLSGTPGGKLITVNVSGYRHSETNRPAVPGEDLTLAVSLKLQKILEEELGLRRAAAVAVDPRNGDILALASEPSFDPGAMSPRVPASLWEHLNKNPARPLLNRAVTGLYPPGSTFKPAVALAALGKGLGKDYQVDCDGTFRLGDMRLRCASRYGHGPGIKMAKAIEVSCNPYFCDLGVHAGIDAVRDFASLLGFGKKTGIGLGGEAAGLLPDDGWKRRTGRGAWRQGDTANLSIGQGYLLVTPLQMAMYAAFLANGGTLWRPRLYLGENAEAVHIADIPKEHLDVIRAGMHGVVYGDGGSGRRAKVDGVEIAAKTGTAEYGPRSNRRKHTWMIAFAPFANPEIAVAVVVEDGESGGLTAAPVVSKLLAGYFGKDAPTGDLDGAAGAADEGTGGMQ